MRRGAHYLFVNLMFILSAGYWAVDNVEKEIHLQRGVEIFSHQKWS